MSSEPSSVPQGGFAQTHTVREHCAVPSKAVKRKKKLVRRADKDYSQLVRRSYQAAFLLLNVWLGGVFYFWVLGLETGTATGVADPPAGIAGMYRLPRVRGNLSGRRRAAARAAENFQAFFQISAPNSFLGDGCRRCDLVFWNCGLRESLRHLGFAHSRGGLSATCASRQRGAPPYARRSGNFALSAPGWKTFMGR